MATAVSRGKFRSRPARLKRLGERVEHVVDVRHVGRVDRERPRDPDGFAEPAVALPEGPENRDSGHDEADAPQPV